MHAIVQGVCLMCVVAIVATTAGAANADTVVTFPVGEMAADSVVTFTVSSGPLSIAVPESKALGSTGRPGTITSTLGTVTVTDARALLAPTWAATVSSTDFTTGGGSALETIANTEVNYWSGPATASSGAETDFVAWQPTSADQVALSTSPTVFSLSTGLGNNSAGWDPTLVVGIPADAIAGDYTGTVTHSVA
jgi:hypothetical protein